MILAAALAAQVALATVQARRRSGRGAVRFAQGLGRSRPKTAAGRSICRSSCSSALEPDKKPDPFFMLAGGPGDAPSFNASFFSRVFHDIRRRRDIVLVDLRGTGKSSPLFCPELGRPGANGIYDENQLSVPAVRACRARLEKTSISGSTRPRSPSTTSRKCDRRSATVRSTFTARRMARASRRSTCDVIPKPARRVDERHRAAVDGSARGSMLLRAKRPGDRSSLAARRTRRAPRRIPSSRLSSASCSSGWKRIR